VTDTRHPAPEATRRQRIAPGARGFGYHRPVLTILLVFIGLLNAVGMQLRDVE
jgi:hypothetical protein